MHAVCAGCDGDIRAGVDQYSGGLSSLNGLRHEMEKVARVEMLFSNLDVFNAIVYRAMNAFQEVFIAAGDVVVTLDVKVCIALRANFLEPDRPRILIAKIFFS